MNAAEKLNKAMRIKEAIEANDFLILAKSLEISDEILNRVSPLELMDIIAVRMADYLKEIQSYE